MSPPASSDMVKKNGAYPLGVFKNKKSGNLSANQSEASGYSAAEYVTSTRNSNYHNFGDVFVFCFLFWDFQQRGFTDSETAVPTHLCVVLQAVVL